MAEESRALVVRSLAEEAEITERARIKKERREHRLAIRQEEIKHIYAEVMLDAARVTNLRKHMFKDDEELTKLGLTRQQVRIVRQFEEPKKSAAFGVESSAKLIEAEARAKADQKRGDVHIDNLTISIPEKSSEGLPAPIIIDVEAK